MSYTAESDSPASLVGRRVAFVGKLGGVNRQEARQLVRALGGIPVEQPGPDVSLIVIGADELPLWDEEEMLDPPTRDAIGAGEVELIGETQLWQWLGLIDAEHDARRLYTPAMLADLLGVPVATIRRWHRRKLIVPAREVQRLPYFDFQEVATARQLAQLLATGASPTAIERKLARLARFVPDVERPLAQLSIIVHGKQILLRQGEGLIEPGGQLRIDFDALDSPNETAKPGLSRPADIVSLAAARLSHGEPTTPAEMLQCAADLEDAGLLAEAVDMYRTALAVGGPNAEICFLLAELLYRQGDVTAARERYYMTVELDETYVEGRANLGCVLAETGEPELAIAAFLGALDHHRDFPDVHYHLARTLDDLGRRDEAETHWRAFLALAPTSPWASEARDRLGEPEHEIAMEASDTADDIWANR